MGLSSSSAKASSRIWLKTGCSMSLSTAEAVESRQNDGRDAEQILIVDKSRQHFMWRLIHDGLIRLALDLKPFPSSADWLASIVYSGFQLRVLWQSGSHASYSYLFMSLIHLRYSSYAAISLSQRSMLIFIQEDHQSSFPFRTWESMNEFICQPQHCCRILATHSSALSLWRRSRASPAIWIFISGRRKLIWSGFIRHQRCQVGYK